MYVHVIVYVMPSEWMRTQCVFNASATDSAGLGYGACGEPQAGSRTSGGSDGALGVFPGPGPPQRCQHLRH